MRILLLASLLVVAAATASTSQSRPRARDLGITPGTLSPGPLNAITDVAGVRVGHEGRTVRALPHDDVLALLAAHHRLER